MSDADAGRWSVERLSASAAEVHGREIVAVAGPTVWVIGATDRALVLGSSQALDDVDVSATAGAGIEVVRRRSGGGAVLVDAADVVWIDVIVPRGDPLWNDDIGIGALWLGELWCRVLAGLGHEAEMHRSAMQRDPLARIACFVGRAPGEVLLDSRKVVGVSQRRTRNWARMQCACLLRWDGAGLVGLLASVDDREAERILGAGRGVGGTGETIVAAFLAELAAL